MQCDPLFLHPDYADKQGCMESMTVPRAARAFTLIEVVIVLIIVGLIGAIAVSRFGSSIADSSTIALRQNLSLFRTALDHYQAEHSQYPTDPILGLVSYTDINGNTSNTKTVVFQYGPYLGSIPQLPVGIHLGENGVVIDNTLVFSDTTAWRPTLLAAGSQAFSSTQPVIRGFGWRYNPVTGVIRSNTTTEKDAREKLYNTY